MIQINLFAKRNRDTDVENKCMVTKAGMKQEIGIDIYIYTSVYKIES